MRFGICTIDDFDVKGKTVLCRVDINQAIDREKRQLKDITRIKGCIPTIKELMEKKAKVVLLAHQGSDIEYNNYFTTEPHSKVLSELLGVEVQFIDDVCGPAAREKIKGLKDGDVLLLDNVRHVAEEMTLFETKLNLTPERQSKTLVIEKLAPLADIYVCDAFAAAHRCQPTLVGFQEVLPSAMGRLFEEEYCAVSQVMEHPDRPCVYLLGGAKIQDAFLMMKVVLKSGSADKIITGGLAGNIMLMASGVRLGEASEGFIRSSNLEEFIIPAKELLSEFADKVVLPVDVAGDDGGRKEFDVSSLPADVMLTDIGHKTVDMYIDILKQAKTVFINGPMGIYEKPETEYGTRSLWEHIASSDIYSIIGGGDSVAAANKFGVSEGISYICTGGGALIRFLTGEELPVVTALKKAGSRKKQK